MAFLKTSDSIIIKATLTDEGRKLLGRGEFKISNLPVLEQNNKLDVSPTQSGSFCYLSVNDETTDKLNNISNFRFLTSNKLENTKIVVESGLASRVFFDADGYLADRKAREHFILKKFLLDSDYFVFVDDRFINKIHGIKKDSKFENFASGEAIVNLKTDEASPALSYESEFANYTSRILEGIPNLRFDHLDRVTGYKSAPAAYTVHEGPRGSLIAFNPTVNQEMKINSTSATDFRFTKYGKTEQFLFAELPLDKFDYINTTIYIIGGTTNSRVTIPIRIIRYAGK